MRFGKLAWFSAVILVVAACHPNEGSNEPRSGAKRYKTIPAEAWPADELTSETELSVLRARPPASSGPID